MQAWQVKDQADKEVSTIQTLPSSISENQPFSQAIQREGQGRDQD
jgi:hypothetical protein